MLAKFLPSWRNPRRKRNIGNTTLSLIRNPDRWIRILRRQSKNFLKLHPRSNEAGNPRLSKVVHGMVKNPAGDNGFVLFADPFRGPSRRLRESGFSPAPATFANPPPIISRTPSNAQHPTCLSAEALAKVEGGTAFSALSSLQIPMDCRDTMKMCFSVKPACAPLALRECPWLFSLPRKIWSRILWPTDGSLAQPPLEIQTRIASQTSALIW